MFKSMKKNLLLTVFITVHLVGISQENKFEKPDYDLIQTEIQDSTSIFYYPKLLSRLNSFDTTLSIEEYKYLYYGYVFQKEYQPYRKSSHEAELLAYYRSQNISESDYETVIQLATKAIEEFPFDLRPLKVLGYVYHLKGDEDMAQKTHNRFHGVIGAIMSSGDGKTCETGFHIISVSHEYVLLNMFQFQVKYQSLTDGCDYLRLERNKEKIKGLYFNIEKLFKKNQTF